MSEDPKPADKAPDEPTTRIGRFITKYHTFLSSTMLGAAGLAATSIWQYRQADVAQKQAESQQRVAETAADNSWKIERADILSKNLGTLAATGPGTVEQRYGVLLSLTRSNVLDPELAVTYALELGKDSPEDMLSVLANATTKDYGRLARAYTLSCDERYGTTPAAPVCDDKTAGRSAAIGQLFADDAELGLDGGAAGPLALLADERQVQLGMQRLAALFTPFLTGMYERRQWDEIARFNAYSPGAHVVSAIVLAAARTGEFVTDDEAKQLEQFHDSQTTWLGGYLMGKTCDAECKSRLLDVMVSHYSDAAGDYDTAVRQLLDSSRTQSGVAITHLHTRLLWCQLDDSDLTPLRDDVLIPAALRVLDEPNADPAVRDGILSLISLVPEPSALDVPGSAAWDALTAAIAKSEKYTKVLKDRRAAALRQRATPPSPTLKKANFCAGAAPATPDATLDATLGATPTTDGAGPNAQPDPLGLPRR